jgi:hypothetical protein
MVESHRIFYCARCQEQIVICTRCDHGHRYCSDECSEAARKKSMREAGARYQSTDQGRQNHAARQARYEERQANLTHQGSSQVPGELRISPRATDVDVAHQEVKDVEETMRGPGLAPVPDPMRCHFCGRACGSFTRFGFLSQYRATG